MLRDAIGHNANNVAQRIEPTVEELFGVIRVGEQIAQTATMRYGLDRLTRAFRWLRKNWRLKVDELTGERAERGEHCGRKPVPRERVEQPADCGVTPR